MNRRILKFAPPVMLIPLLAAAALLSGQGLSAPAGRPYPLLAEAANPSAALVQMATGSETPTPATGCLVPTALDIVLVIDRSGSMGTESGCSGIPCRTRLEWAKLAANNLVDSLAGPGGSLSPHRVAVISFAGSSIATLNLVLNAGTTAAAAHAAINSITTGGSTYIAPALITAADQLYTLGRADAGKVVILLSDGRNWTNPGETPDPATRTANTIGVIPALHGAADTVYAVGIGTEGERYSDLDEPLLQQIAEGPPGEYIHVQEASDLPDIYSDVWNGICANEALPPTSFGGPWWNPFTPYSYEPVDLATGNYFHGQTDVSISGIGLPLSFSRSYNSLDTYSGPLGTGWTHNYDMRLLIDSTNPSAKVITVVNEGGRQDTYEEQPDGGYLGPPGVFERLVENEDGSFTLTRRDRTVLQFDALGVLQSMTDRNGNLTALTYDIDGRLTSVTDPSGRSLTFAYDGSGRITSVTDPLSRITTYAYDANGDLVSVTDPNGGTTSDTYDSGNRMLTITDTRGNTIMTNVYDSFGRVIQQTNAVGKTWSFSYDFSTRTSTETDPLGHHKTYVYDYYHRTLSQTDALGGTTSYTYDTYGNRDSVTDALGRTTHMTYDERGNLLSVTDALGNTTTFTYSAGDDLLSKTDPLSRTTSYTYDTSGNLLTSTDALGGVTSFTYNGAGQMLTSADPRGKTSSFTYDANGYQNSATDPLGHITTSTYDAGGRVLFQTDPLSHTTTFTYDGLDRLLTVTDALGNTTAYGYDANGNKTSVVDANAKLTSYTYDALNQLQSVADAEGGTVTYGYDDVGNRTSMTDANGHATTYGYDELNRLTSVTDPEGNTTSYTYDAVGNRITRLDANGITTTYSYDDLNRLTKITYPDQPAVSYTYDALGNRLSMTDLTGTTTYSYDALYRLTSVVNPGGATVSYGYDAAGNRTSITYPDGKLVAYGYDDDVRMSTVTDWSDRVTTYTYDDASRLTGADLPNGVHTERSYNDANQLLEIAHTKDTNNLMTIGYSLDDVGNRLTRSETVETDPTLTDTYGYDDLYRLTSVDYGNTEYPDQTYAYDPMGNRTQLVEGTTTTNYTYDTADRLLTAGSTEYAFDANGNQTREGNRTFTYDRENRLIQVADWTSTPDGVCADSNWDGTVNSGDLLAIANAFGTRAGSDAYQPVTDLRQDGVVNSGDLLLTAGKLMEQCQVIDANAYNGDGLRIFRSEDGVTERYSWDSAGSLPLILQVSEGTNFAYGLDLLYQTSVAGDLQYLHDGLGSTEGVTDDGGAILASYDADAFGKPRTLPTGVSFTFIGQQLDRSGLLYMRTRFYDSKLGEFLTVDSSPGISTATESLGRYRFVANSPANWIDPTGASFLDAVGGAASAAWNRTTEVASAAWDKTKEVAVATWDTTKEVAVTAWNQTKDTAAVWWTFYRADMEYQIQRNVASLPILVSVIQKACTFSFGGGIPVLPPGLISPYPSIQNPSSLPGPRVVGDSSATGSVRVAAAFLQARPSWDFLGTSTIQSGK